MIIIIDLPWQKQLLFNEALDFALMAASFEINCSVYFKHDSIVQLFMLPENSMYKKILSFELYDIKNIYFCITQEELIKSLKIPLVYKFCEPQCERQWLSDPATILFKN